MKRRAIIRANNLFSGQFSVIIADIGVSVEQRTMAALDAVGLAFRRNQNTLALSCSETQRPGLVRAMAIGPDMLFLEKPTVSIDEKSSRIVEELILALKKDARMMIVMTTHDREQADRLADRVVLMREGTILSRASVLEEPI